MKWRAAASEAASKMTTAGPRPSVLGQEHLSVPGGLLESFVMLARDVVVLVSPRVGIGGQLGSVAGIELIGELHQSMRSTSQSVTGLSFLKWLMTKVGKALVVNWGG